MSNKLIFVYGSLLSGLHNHCLLDNDESSLVGLHTTEPMYSLLDLGSYPGVTKNGHTAISGEVWEVSEAVYARVEMLEGYPSFYDRTELTTPYGQAGMYYLEAANYERYSTVESGDWKSYVQEKMYG